MTAAEIEYLETEKFQKDFPDAEVYYLEEKRELRRDRSLFGRKRQANHLGETLY